MPEEPIFSCSHPPSRSVQGHWASVASDPQVDVPSGREVAPVVPATVNRRRLSRPTRDARSLGPKGRSPVAKLTALSLPGRPGRCRGVLIGIERLCQESVRPPRKGSGFGIELRALCLDQELGRQRNRFFLHRDPNVTNPPEKMHPYERTLSPNSPTTRPRCRPSWVQVCARFRVVRHSAASGDPTIAFHPKLCCRRIVALIQSDPRDLAL